MYEKVKTSLVVVAVLAILFSIGLRLAAPVVMAQEPVTEEIENQASLVVPFNSVEVTLPTTSVEPGSELSQWEKTHLQSPIPAEYAAPTLSVKPGSELSLWEKRNLISPISADDNAAAATSVKPGSELTVWERLNFISPFAAD